MADSQAPVTAKSAAVSPKKAKAPTAKKPSPKPSHPPTSSLVDGAIKSLHERGGSSLQAIKKFITSNNKVDAAKLAPFIKKYLKNAVGKGHIVQVKGKGASGSFKLSAAALKPKADKKPAQKAANKKPIATKPKKAAGEKKAKKPTGKKAVATPEVKAAKPKTASKQKATKPSKLVAKKPKTPKPKTATRKPAAGVAKPKTAKPKALKSAKAAKV